MSHPEHPEHARHPQHDGHPERPEPPAPAVPAAHRARFTLDPDFTVGPVDPRLYGSFVEHLGRCVHTGIHEPGHPAADADGLRTDVLELVRELGVTVIRYPGGNFVSGHRWEDSVGPVAERPRRLDVAWRSTESHRFGLSEFMAFLRKLGPRTEPMMALNLGTRGVMEAMELVEYANHPGGTALSDLRVAHGDKDPFGIRMWCLGNEMDGTWQTGHRTAEEYGRLAARTARALRQIDPGLELVACGSSGRDLPTFAAWEATVLAETYEVVDHVSLHAYYEETDGDRDSFLASAEHMDVFIREVIATCDHVAARLKSPKRLTLSFDEWNVWYQRRPNPRPVEDWQEAPRLLEDVYTVTDAVVAGSLLITLLRHADRIAVACLAQLVNVIAPIMTEPGGPAWRQTTFFPFAQASRYGRGTVLDVRVTSPTHRTEKYGEVPLLHATAVRGEDGTLTVFAVNRDRHAPLPLDVALRGLDLDRVVEHSALADADPEARNTLEAPNRVVPHRVTGTVLDEGVLHALLEPMSWNVIRLA
ncbi:alpha-N-arabinofuranosidase [Streptomyces sp. NPDC126503]|uniref:arabinosylfuranosidase ArfA n=1 Tax=Streptomyces sp. NPDC126503 TaxID=3155315 RepID=UPI0033272FAB